MSWKKYFTPVKIDNSGGNMSPLNGRGRPGPARANYSSYLPDVYELVPLGAVLVVLWGVVATRFLKLKLISLITYCSGILPSDSLTIIFVTLAASTNNHFLVSGSRTKKQSPYLNALRSMRKILVSKLFCLHHFCRLSLSILTSVAVGSPRKCV